MASRPARSASPRPAWATPSDAGLFVVIGLHRNIAIDGFRSTQDTLPTSHKLRGGLGARDYVRA